MQFSDVALAICDKLLERDPNNTRLKNDRNHIETNKIYFNGRYQASKNFSSSSYEEELWSRLNMKIKIGYFEISEFLSNYTNLAETEESKKLKEFVLKFTKQQKLQEDSSNSSQNSSLNISPLSSPNETIDEAKSLKCLVSPVELSSNEKVRHQASTIPKLKRNGNSSSEEKAELDFIDINIYNVGKNRKATGMITPQRVRKDKDRFRQFIFSSTNAVKKQGSVTAPSTPLNTRKILK